MKNKCRLISLLIFLLLFTVCFGSFTASAKEVLSESVSEREEDDKLTQMGAWALDMSQEFVFVQGETEYKLYKSAMTVDLNSDGKCTAFDAREMLRISSKLSTFDGNLTDVDVSRDGRITATDARLVLRYCAQIDEYYALADGTLLSGYASFDGGTVYFSDGGALAKGIKTIDGVLHHFGLDGKMSTGLVKSGGTVYFFNDDGTPYSGKKTVGKDSYLFKDGKAVTGLVKEGEYYYYYDKNGVMQTGTHQIDSDTYIFDDTGKGNIYKPQHPSEFKTAMIGDSVVATMAMFDFTEYIDFYGRVSLNSYSIFNKKIQGSDRYVIDEIKGRGYDKVIILMGINELGSDISTWKNQYRKIINGVRERAPGAEIYIHAILPVNEQKAFANGYSTKNSVINKMNDALKQLAKEENVKFIDAREVLADKNGSLPYASASDGVHPGYDACKKWTSWLLKKICE